MAATDFDPCAGCPVIAPMTTETTAALDGADTSGAWPFADDEDEVLGLCEWAASGPPYDGCDRDAVASYPGGERLCRSHAIALYGDDTDLDGDR